MHVLGNAMGEKGAFKWYQQQIPLRDFEWLSKAKMFLLSF